MSRPNSLHDVNSIDESANYRLDDAEWLEREVGDSADRFRVQTGWSISGKKTPATKAGDKFKGGIALKRDGHCMALSAIGCIDASQIFD